MSFTRSAQQPQDSSPLAPFSRPCTAWDRSQQAYVPPRHPIDPEHCERDRGALFLWLAEGGEVEAPSPSTARGCYNNVVKTLPWAQVRPWRSQTSLSSLVFFVSSSVNLVNRGVNELNQQPIIANERPATSASLRRTSTVDTGNGGGETDRPQLRETSRRVVFCADLNRGGIPRRDSARARFGPGEERPNVVMRNQRSPMGQSKSDEHPPYEELIEERNPSSKTGRKLNLASLNPATEGFFRRTTATRRKSGHWGRLPQPRFGDYFDLEPEGRSLWRILGTAQGELQQQLRSLWRFLERQTHSLLRRTGLVDDPTPLEETMESDSERGEYLGGVDVVTFAFIVCNEAL
ncbi:hypothetical protein Taro_049192 [Colocasia esculenta]|uniref:Uncharacterized protein n=1 Tax=Colocasia esculenta TaxID=4460 RepID=A0A843XAB3_COLES|nr:hypothetical protein [Colocasia esculenta]